MGQTATKKPSPTPKVTKATKIPANIEAERAVLGAVLLNNEAIAQIHPALCTDDFWSGNHRIIFDAMLEMRETGTPIDAISLVEHLRSCKKLKEVGGVAYLSELADQIPSMTNVRYYVQIVVEKSQLRQAWSLGKKIAKLIDDHTNLAMCLDYFDRQIRAIRSKSAWIKQDKDDTWREHLQWTYDRSTGKRKVTADRINFMRILGMDQRLRGCLVYDEFRQDIVCLAPPPWNLDELGELGGRTAVGGTWMDEDYTRLSLWLEQEYGAAPSNSSLAELVHTVARRDSYHPIREALDNLQWDGVERLDNWLKTYLGARSIMSDDYLKLVGPKWIISAVARVFDPGCQAHHVLILEGLQGMGKSTALRTLATVGGRAWFSDTPIQLSQPKDTFVTLQGLWVVELAEMEAILRAESTVTKSFFSSSSDRFRPPYMRVARDFPRQCIFCGSVNGDDYLKDATGDRRYWPVACSQIDMPALARDRDQLWAEAVHRYKSGERWWPETKAEKELCAIEQTERRKEDIWAAPIAEWLDDQTANDFTPAEILTGAVGLSLERCGRFEEMRLADVMSLLPEWTRGRVQRGDSRPRGYKRQTRKGGDPT